MKRLSTILLLLTSLTIWAKADNCDFWNVRIVQRDTSVCLNSAINLDVAVTNDSMTLDSCRYEWLVQVQGGNFVSLGVTTTSQHSYTFSASGVYSFVCIVTPDTCNALYSDTISVTTYSELTPGSIFSNYTICYNAQPSAIQSIALPTGCDGNYVYVWQDSIAGGKWTDIANSNSATYQPSALTQNIYYRRKVTNALCNEEALTSAVEVIVYAPLTAGSVFTDDTICYNAQPSAIQSLALPTGCDGNYVYTWQDSITGGTWNDIVNSNSITYQPGILSQNTYYRRKVTNAYCGVTAFTDAVKVEVRRQMTAPVVAQYADTVCYDSVPESLSVTTQSLYGVGDSVRYQWQESVDNINWTSIQSATALTYQPSALQSSRYYRVVATSEKGCGVLNSNTIKVNVYPDLQITTQGTNPLCYMSAGVISVSATGNGERYSYQWQDSASGIWSNLGTNSSSLTTSAKTVGTYYYRCVVTPTAGCSSKTSATITVQVYAALTSGSIFTNDTICYNTQPSVIQSTALPIGCDGNYVYTWQDSIAGGQWTDIASSNTTTYQPSALTQNTYYRRKVYNTYCNTTAYTNVVKVEVRRQMTAPVVAQYADTVCYDSVPQLLSVTTQSLYGVGDTVTYQWQESTDNVNWTSIQSATALTYQPLALQSSRYYRVVATSEKGCGVLNSNTIKINVYPDLQITTQGTNPLCYMSTGVIGVLATGNGGRYSYQWQDSASGVWSNLGTNSPTFTTPAKTEGTYYYRCVVTPTAGCSSKTSATITVQVYAALTAGSIFTDDTICYNTQPSVIQSTSLPTGCDGNYIYTWQDSISGGQWTDIASSNTTTYQPSALTQNTYYRRKVHNTYCNTTSYTNAVKVEVRRQMTAPVLAQYPDTLCYNFETDLTVLTASLYGVGDTVVYQWMESADNIQWQDIAGETALSLHTEALTADRYYKIRATSIQGCGTLYSQVVKVNVFPDLVITINPIDTLCYMTSGQLTLSATGDGNKYAYQWQESADSINFTDIRNERRSDYWTDNKPDGKYFYRCVVTPRNGCTPDTSDVFVVNVYAEFIPGKIGDNDTVCRNDDALELGFKVNPTGGETGKYSYQWEYSIDQNDWYNVANETSVTYTPRNMQQTTYYRVRVRNSCGLEYTDTVEIFVNPLPDTVIIAGDELPCHNQYEYYSFEQMAEGFDYQWSIDNENAGEIVTDPSNKTQIRVLWTTGPSTANVVLTVTNEATGCQSANYYPVNTTSERTPDTTIIIRKPNSNIFVCQDSTTNHYQWGSTEKSSGTEKAFDNTDRRYCQVEGGIDTLKYLYWVKLWNGDTARCVSQSLYTSSNDEIYIQQPTQNIRVVSSVKDAVTIAIDNPSEKDVTVRLYTTTGVELFSQPLGKEQSIKTDLPVSIPSGVYMLHVEIGTDCETIKLIAE